MRPVPPRLTIAIRGSGAIGMRHARLLKDIGARVLIVPERAERIPELRAVGFDATSWAELPHVDGVVVCTRTGLHSQGTVEALQRAPSLVEKPIARTTYEAEGMLAASAAAGTMLHRCGSDPAQNFGGAGVV